MILVTGPELAGVGGVIAALRERLPEHTFVESGDLAPGDVPMAVVFVVSAAAPLTGSDRALLDAAAADVDAVIGVVSKIDVHRGWREVLSVNRDTLAAHAPRYRQLPWVGVATAPDLGEPRVDDLVAAVREQLADPDITRRNRLRALESRLRCRQARVAASRERRNAALRQRRALGGQIRQVRVELSYFARNRCAALRAELQRDAAGLTRRTLPGFEAYARGRLQAVLAEVDEYAAARLAGIAPALDPPARAELPAVDVAASPLRSRRLETRLMTLLGAGFGLGVAFTLSRLLADLAPAGIVAGVATGLAVAVWVVSTRGLLHDRAVLDRWVGEATASLGPAAAQLVAVRVLGAESALSAPDEAEEPPVVERVSAVVAQPARYRAREISGLQDI